MMRDDTLFLMAIVAGAIVFAIARPASPQTIVIPQNEPLAPARVSTDPNEEF